MWGRKGLVIAGFLGLLGLGAIILTLWGYCRDPVWSLPPPEHGLQAERTPLAAPDHRLFEHVTLHGKLLGDIVCNLSLPDPLPLKKLPVVLVLGGLVTGADSIRCVQDAGDNAIVSYAWPLPLRLRGVSAFMLKAPDLYQRVMTIPGQAASVLHWLIRQPWADAGRVSLLGFSQGALAVPGVEDIAAHDGTRVGWTIIAYGGAPLGALLAANPHMRPAWLRKALAPWVDLVFHSLEPTVHLPRLSGKFLVLEGRDDSLIPAAARNLLRDAVPEPKTVITFEGNHMGVGPDQMALLRKIIDASKEWLIENGAINPGPD
ncbi:MAG: alpha/beta hydrolase family protein [Desulfobaccales bacterium]